MTNCPLSTVAMTLACLAGAQGAIAQEEPSKLPIEVPKAAAVNFEAEGAGKEFLTTIKHLMSGNMTDPTAPTNDKVTVKTSLGNIDFKVEDLAPLLDKIHDLHVVSYTYNGSDDIFKWEEKRFTSAGLKRVAFIPGANGVLITHHNGDSDNYGIVTRQKDVVVVLRTQGAPGLGDLGQVIFGALSKAVTKAVSDKQHPHSTGH